MGGVGGDGRPSEPHLFLTAGVDLAEVGGDVDVVEGDVRVVLPGVGERPAGRWGGEGVGVLGGVWRDLWGGGEL